ncbi:hypothetical protein ACFSX9_14580 [Flavobacterium ardleyense]|uniref:Lipoprotein n=1 Tax=Flavobacterium ardleyense TaxID=2038737 RepID=A0ABW5ZB01_9FLAO
MNKLAGIIVVFLLTSCGFQHIKFNDEDEIKRAVKVGDDYHNELKQKQEITDFKLVSVENTKVFVGKGNDTIKQVYEMIYEIENDNKKENVLVKFKKTKNKFEAKSEAIN